MLDRSASLLQLTGQVERWLVELYAHRDFVRRNDPVEAVHELRVASRRLRAFLDTFEPFLDPRVVARARKPLRKITRAVGTLREWDVHAAGLAELLAERAADPERVALEYLLERTDARRTRQRRRALRKLRRIDLNPLGPSLREALDTLALREATGSTTFNTLAWVALEAAIDHVGRELPPDDGTEHARQMHLLRIAVKRLRYTVELVRPALGESYSELHQHAKGLQKLLGDHHDRVVLQQLVEAEQARLARHGRAALVRSLKPALSSIEAGRRQLFEQYCDWTRPLDRGELKRQARAALAAGA